MQKQITIVGGGIVGATAAYYLSKQPVQLTLYDDGVGQATSASAGIICPWLSQRRNKAWYRLTSKGAAFYPQLMHCLKQDGINELPYEQVGAIVLKKTVEQVHKLYQLACDRKKEATMIGDLHILSPEDIASIYPDWKGTQSGLFCSGGGRVDGKKLITQLLDLAEKNGAKIVREKVQLSKDTKGNILVCDSSKSYKPDQLLLATGAWLKPLIRPLNLSCDIRPQKGQLIECLLPDFKEQSRNWPVCMLHGEIDILPFQDGKIIIGASHENDQGFDLTPDTSIHEAMHQEASEMFAPLKTVDIHQYRIGTRAYTSDFSPFFGAIPSLNQVYCASGLGSSGLTSGAFIGYLLSQLMNNQVVEFECKEYDPMKYIF